MVKGDLEATSRVVENEAELALALRGMRGRDELSVGESPEVEHRNIAWIAAYRMSSVHILFGWMLRRRFC